MNPHRTVSRPARGPGALLAVVALIVAMVAVSIVGSAYFRPAPSARTTLELGGATPVRLAPRAADASIAGVLDVVAPAVAFITIPDRARSGSGVVVHEAGFVVTNAHVVDGVERVRVAFDDGIEYDGEVYGVDPATDLAVVKVDVDKELTAAPLGDSDRLQVGEFVIALGAPFGLEATATSGIVSGLHRSGLGIARFEDFIVTDAPINRGNSGGPLVNLRGEVVGINTAIIAGDSNARSLGTFAGVGFAIPVNVMRVVAQRLIGDGGLLPLPHGGTEQAAPEGADAGGVSGDAGGGTAPRHRVIPVAGEPPAGAFDVRTLRSAPAGTVPAVKPRPGAVGYVQTWDGAGKILRRGSGFVVSVPEGHLLVTNEHVVRGAGTVSVYFPGQDGYFDLTASLLYADTGHDLALLTLPDDPRLAPLAMRTADQVSVDDPVTAVGVRAAADARLSIADNRGRITEIGVRQPGLATRALILATDAGIEVGDSGGPLLDASGDVVGVMVARATDVAPVGGEQRSYAVAFRLREELRMLIDNASNPGFELGFQPIFPRGANAFIFVLGVTPDGAASRAGLRRGDHIVAIDGQPVPADEAGQRTMIESFMRLRPGSMVDVEIVREGQAPERQTLPFVVPSHVPAP